ncbi:MAG: xanthine dehydrogenase family protein subunit M [Anaerolineales bacterium]|jgi:carbon-monoxide dehydrogenase medium subunit
MINPHPGLPEFEYVNPSSLDEASKFLATHERDARPFSGGTDCLVRLRDGILKLNYLVDIKNLDETNEMSFDPKRGLTIGAAVSMNRIASNTDVINNYPILVEAANSVASYQLRNRASLVGNICNASPAGDTIGACMALEGVLNIHGISGFKQTSLDAFFTSPGKTILKPGDIVVSISLPIPPPGFYGVYKKLGRNKISDLAIVGVTVLGYPSKKTTSGYKFKIVLASVAPVPFEAIRAEAVLEEEKISQEVISEAAQVSMESISPIDDVRGSARYRRYMVRNLTMEALTEVWSKLSK